MFTESFEVAQDVQALNADGATTAYTTTAAAVDDGACGEKSSSIDRPVANSFYPWMEVYPELLLLERNIEVILRESKLINKWTPWPEDHFSINSSYSNNKDWTVFPLLYTFPAYDDSKISWVPSTTALLPETTALLKSIPTIRTALFSKLGPETELSNHTGWEDLANYVLRCHICLDIPKVGLCGLNVEGEEEFHKPGHIIVFDDSKNHRAFNYSETEERTVLIVDLLRPKHIPIGTATGGHTDELDSFVSWFR